MTSGIYSLSFNNTNKIYIGQSKDIEERFKRHINSLSKGKAPNKLQEAFYTFGDPILNILLIWEVESERKDIEEAAIVFFNTINNGFNSMHSVVDPLKEINNGKGIHLTKYNNTKYIDALFLLANYPNKSYKELSNILNMSIDTLSAMKSGRTHKNLKEKYPEEYMKMRAR